MRHLNNGTDHRHSKSCCDQSSPARRTIKLEGPEDPHLRNSRFRRSRDLAHASIPLAQTPWSLTGRAWLEARAQREVIHNIILPIFTSQHYGDVKMSAMASQITSLTIVCSTVYLGAVQRKHQSSAPLAFVWGIHRWPVNSTHKGPVTRKMFPFDDVIMKWHDKHQP